MPNFGIHFILCALIISILAISLSAAQPENTGKTEFPVMEGPYLGQKPPGIVPEIFAPGIISDAGYRLH